MSANLAPPMRDLRVQSRPDSPGAQPRRRQSGEMGPTSLSDLPRDVILGVLDEMRPVGPHTTTESTAEKPMVSPGHLECRTSLLNVCLASRTFYELAIPHLYRDPLIKDRRELYRFFCSIAKQSDRRLMIRSFTWAGVLWADHADVESSIRRLEEETTFSAECWNLIKDQWPRSNVDLDIAKLFGIDGRDTMKDSKLLGSVLAMCPRIKCLFMLNGAIIDRSSGIHPCPELDAILPFLRQYELGIDGEGSSRAQPYGHLFLQELETLTIEGHSNMAASINTEIILALLFINSPLLHRIELKHPPIFRGVLGMLRSHFGTRAPLTASVKEVSLLHAYQPQDDMAAIVALFPNIVSLYAVFRDGTDRPPSSFDLPPEASEALLKVSGTLETLSLTTSPETCPAKGHWVRFKSYPSSLSTLNQMTKLKDLTTESIWLFGTEDPAIALQLPHLLPPSLVRLHLIDYWGNSDPAVFYPEFPNKWTPLQFYGHVFEALCNETSVCLAELREVTFSSNYFNSLPQSNLSNGGLEDHDEASNTEDFMQVMGILFGRVGVRFRLIL